MVLAIAAALMLLAMIAHWTDSRVAFVEAERPSFVLCGWRSAWLRSWRVGRTGCHGMLSAVAPRGSSPSAGFTAPADFHGREPAATVSRLSPFHYFEPMTVITGQPLSAGNTRYCAIDSGAIASRFAIGRRDI